MADAPVVPPTLDGQDGAPMTSKVENGGLSSQENSGKDESKPTAADAGAEEQQAKAPLAEAGTAAQASDELAKAPASGFGKASESQTAAAEEPAKSSNATEAPGTQLSSEPQQSTAEPLKQADHPKVLPLTEDKPEEEISTDKLAEEPTKKAVESSPEKNDEQPKSPKMSVFDGAKDTVKEVVQEVKEAVKSDKDKDKDKTATEEDSRDASRVVESQTDTPMLDAQAAAADPAPVNCTSQADVSMQDADPPSETQPTETTESQADKKRTADEAGMNGSSNTQEMPDSSKPRPEKRNKNDEGSQVDGAKDEPATIPAMADEPKTGDSAAAAPAQDATANGAGTVPARKRSKKEKKPAAPVGKTARRTRSQGLSEAH